MPTSQLRSCESTVSGVATCDNFPRFCSSKTPPTPVRGSRWTGTRDRKDKAKGQISGLKIGRLKRFFVKGLRFFSKPCRESRRRRRRLPSAAAAFSSSMNPSHERTWKLSMKKRPQLIWRRSWNEKICPDGRIRRKWNKNETKISWNKNSFSPTGWSVFHWRAIEKKTH